ncbi:MAG: beta-glucosidase [Acidobacteria bacterium]|nr:beta-glucosidase [Acidobacteriota bacterium]
MERTRPHAVMQTKRPSHPPLFNSFWIAGFESACHVNRAGTRLDMLEATQHDRFVSEDYARLRSVGIATARDTARWHRIEVEAGRYDFSSLEPYAAAARAHGIQVIWDLLHYGWPDGLDLFAPAFVDRFARFAAATARHLRERTTGPLFVTPINELSFFAWAAGAVGWFRPFLHGRGDDVKRQLVRAWIASVDAIREVDPRARIVSVEPLIHTVPPRGKPDHGGRAAGQRNSQWEAWDMIAGRVAPDLGGHDRYLDVVGVNVYHDNQWEVPGGRKIHWHVHPRDPRWMPFHALVEEAHQRCRRPIFVGETSHVGVGRAEWLRELTDEIVLAIERGVPLEGVCLYPIVDRFEWDDPSHWHNSGLWDFVHEPDGSYRRVINEPYAAELIRSQLRLASMGLGSVPTPPEAAQLSIPL